jgi:hypothetical protein
VFACSDVLDLLAYELAGLRAGCFARTAGAGGPLFGSLFGHAIASFQRRITASSVPALRHGEPRSAR